jgi:cardiolipin synthase
MWKTAKIFLIVIVLAFIAGLTPTIINFLNETVVYSVTKGLSLHPHFVAAMHVLWHTVKTYAWHITVIYALIVAFIIFMEGQNPDRTILWMLVLIFLPVFGVIIYLIVGPDFENHKRRKQFQPLRLDRTPFSDDKRFMVGRMLHSLNGADLALRNRVLVLINGDETFTSIKEELKRAQKYIHIESFIINDDELGREVRDILVEDAKRGVKVRVLYDAIGSMGITSKYIRSLERAGIKCFSFMPMAFPMFRRQMNFRNHRKIIVIDDRVAFTGGLNIGDEYLGKGPLGFWRDTHARLEGESVAMLHKVFLDDWCDRTKEKPETVCAEDGCVTEAGEYPEMPIVPLQVVSSGANTPWHAISMGYFSLISRARERLWITTPYLVPGPQLATALKAAALSGVDVRIIIPSTKDHFLVYWGSRGNIEPLLRAGVRIFFYKKGFIHAKTMLADRDICSVGSCNLDVRSLEINFETQLFIYDELLNGVFAAQFEKDFADCDEAMLEEWTQRPFRHKLLESFGKLYSAQI